MINKNLLILGAGQYGFVAKETAESMGCFEKIAFLDDVNEVAIGKLEDFNKFVQDYSSAFVAIGNPEIRYNYIKKLTESRFTVAILIHPKAVVMPSAQLEKGTIIEAQAVVNSNVTVSAGCIISAGAVINHNSFIEDCCHIDCNAVLPAGSLLAAKTKVPCGTVFK